MTGSTQAATVGIAGIGAVSAAGEDVPATLESFRHGRPNPSKILPFESSIECPTFQVIADLPELPGHLNASRSLRLVCRAIREAMDDAGFSPSPGNPGEGWGEGSAATGEPVSSSQQNPHPALSRSTGRGKEAARVGVCLGTTVASQLNNVPFYEAYRKAGHPPLDAVHEYLSANLAHAVGDLLGVTGPRMTVVNACSSGTDAIGIAATWIRAGLCDVAIAGGADELNRVAMAGFWSLGVMSNQLCRPFDRDRAGLNLGEGAGVVILESAAHATARGKAHLFEVAGFGSACDAHHLTAPHPEGRGLQCAIRAALAQANIPPDQVAFINAHGTATLDNDRAESGVIEKLFGPTAPFLSTKGHTGHTLGAAGGLGGGLQRARPARAVDSGELRV